MPDYNQNAGAVEEVELNGARFNVSVAPADAGARAAGTYQPSVKDIGKPVSASSLPLWEDG